MPDRAAILAWIIVAAPAAAGVVSLLSGRLLRARAAVVGFAGSLVAFVAAVWLLASGAAPFTTAVHWAAGVSLALRLDAATLALAILVSGVGALVVQYAGAYFGATDKGARAIGTLALFEAAMLGLVLADDVLLLFVFWELTGVCSFFLIRTDVDKRADAAPAARRALLVTAGGALPMLIGLLHLAAAGGSTRLSVLVAAALPPTTPVIVFLLVLLGVATKSAQTPFHFWLPGAMAAPTPISAFLHSATMVKAGAILLLYLYPICGGTVVWVSLLVPLGAVTCIWGAYHALTQDDIKLLMAWSTVSQLGLLTLTLGLGTDQALRAGALHLFAHGVFKAGLFLAIGAVDHAAHTRRLSELGGLRARMPLAFAAVVVLSGSMMGLPPFAGFLSKELILTKAMLAHPWVHGSAIIGIAVGSIGTVAYTLRFVLGVFGGAPRSDGARDAHAPAAAFVGAPVLLAVVSLASGLLAPLTDRWFLEPVTAALLGYALEAPTLALWHGITPPLVWSALIVTGGTLLYRRLGTTPIPDRLPGDAGATFDEAMEGAQALGGRFATALAGLRPTVYLGLAMLLGLGAALPLAGALLRLQPDGTPRMWAVLALQLMFLIGLLTARGRLTRVLMAGMVGATVALTFRALHAPDLMLTQLLVEVLITVFFALGLRFVRGAAGGQPRRRSRRVLQVAVSVLVGLGAAASVATLFELPADRRLVSYYLEAGPTIAQGRNLVNVILVDFRGIDTLMETVVVVLAALGVGALLRGVELPTAERRERRRGLRVTSSLLRGLAVVTLPLSILVGLAALLKGHDDPGGGFVAGLALAVAGILAVAAYGKPVVLERLRWPPERFALAGVALLLVTLIAPVAGGQPMLTNAHGSLPLLGKWHSALLFDLGVMLAVGGSGLAATVRLLGVRRRLPERRGDAS